MEAALTNLFSPGERLLSCPVGAFGTRFGEIAQRYGCEVETLASPLGAALDPQALRARLEADPQRSIAGVLLTHNETSTGVSCDMAAIAPALRAHGAVTLVDSISGLGASEFRMDDWGYDAVVTASQKGFAAPPGVAMVGFERARVDTHGLCARAAVLLRSRSRARDGAHAGETPWTPPISILYALDVALQRYSRRRNGRRLSHVTRASRNRSRRAAADGLFARLEGRRAFACRRRRVYAACGRGEKPAACAAREARYRSCRRSRRTSRQDRALWDDGRDHGRRRPVGARSNRSGITPSNRYKRCRLK